MKLYVENIREDSGKELNETVASSNMALSINDDNGIIPSLRLGDNGRLGKDKR